MRILLTVDPEIPVPPMLYGGIERIVEGLIVEYRGLGHKVGLAAHPDSKVEVDTFFPWPGLQSQNRMDTVKNIMSLHRAVKLFRPDVVHSFSRLAYMLRFMRSRIPKVMSYQRVPSQRTVKWASRFAGESLQFTGCSEYISGLGRQAAGKWTAIHNFVNTKKYTYVPSVPADAPFVFLSRIEWIKGLHLAIRAIKQTNRKLIVAGNHSADAESKEYWMKEISPQIDGNQITYVGPVNDIQKNELLGRAAAMIVPIQWDEPFGIVFAEALACGTPVISWKRGSLPEIIQDEKTGYLVEKEAQLKEAIESCSRFDRGRCRRVAEERFSAQSIANQYISLYNNS